MSVSLDKLSAEASVAALFPEPQKLPFDCERTTCDCGRSLLVLKSREKTIQTMTGPFVAHETVRHCPACGSSFGSEALLRLVPARCNVAYDVLVHVGQALFQRRRTAGEVLTELAERNVFLSESEVAYLGRKFIAYLGRAHRSAVPGIRQVMETAGGYVLHLDATHEGQAPVLLTGLDGLSEIVLDNTKLPSENADDIEPFLNSLRSSFGVPLACVHDMGKGLCKAVGSVFPGVPDFICHFHFLRDLGKDFLDPAYGRLRKRLRKHAASTRLHQLVRELSKHLQDGDRAAPVAEAIRTGKIPDKVELLPIASAYALARWVLHGKNVGEGYGFPFDRPLLTFAERLVELHRRLPEIKDVYLRDQWQDNEPLYKLVRDISAAATDPQLRRAIAELQWRGDEFDRLREAMRIARPSGDSGLNDEGDAKCMGRIKRGVMEFRRRLDTDRKLATDRLAGKIAKQIDRYADKLFADPITVPGPDGPITIYPQRTNNILEQFFRWFRRQYRRRTGNNSMSRALQTMLADTPLVKNLNNPRYLQILLNGNPTLAERFAELDASPTADQTNDLPEEQRILPGFKKLIRSPKLIDTVVELFTKAS